MKQDNFKVGDFVKLIGDSKNSSILTGKFYQVTKIDKKEMSIQLKIAGDFAWYWKHSFTRSALTKFL